MFYNKHTIIFIIKPPKFKALKEQLTKNTGNKWTELLPAKKFCLPQVKRESTDLQGNKYQSPLPLSTSIGFSHSQSTVYNGSDE